MKCTFVDLCHTIHDGMITYKGLPPPAVSVHLSREDSREKYAAGTEFHIGKIELVANTGTYIDTPFHRYPNGLDLLLAREIPIVEHLCGVAELPDSGFHFFAVPVKVKSLGTFPVRAFAIVAIDQ